MSWFVELRVIRKELMSRVVVVKEGRQQAIRLLLWLMIRRQELLLTDLYIGDRVEAVLVKLFRVLQ